MSPHLAAQLEQIWQDSQASDSVFKEPEMQQITQVTSGKEARGDRPAQTVLQASLPIKRDAQQSGYSYLPPENPLQLPSENIQVGTAHRRFVSFLFHAATSSQSKDRERQQ